MMNEIRFDCNGIPLIKFQSADRIASLRQGHLYAKTLKYYRDREKETGDDQVGDEFEAMLHINEGYMVIPELGQVTNLSDSLLQTANSDDFVFCLFDVGQTFERFTFSDFQKEKLLSFGDTAMLILDRKEFIRRVVSAAEKRNYTVHFDSVKYTNPSVDNASLFVSLLGGTWNIAFWKRDKYAYQQESRFVFTPGNGDDHIDLEIGDISDITAVLPTEKILTAMIQNKQ